MPKRDKVGEIYEDEDDLDYASSNSLQYRAKRIEDHWIPLEIAVKQWADKLGATHNAPGGISEATSKD